MISVVIPTCDRPIEFLTDAINSALAQSLKPGQIIVVDNGNGQVNAGALPQDVVLYRLPARIGPSRARNFGAAMAGGEFVAFLDDDDYWDPAFLEKAMSTLQSRKVECVYGRIDILRRGIQQRHSLPTDDEVSTSVLLRRNPGLGGINFLIRKEAYWRAGGFDERLLVSEDRSFAIEVLKTGSRIAIEPDAVAIMREHDQARQRQRDMTRFGFILKYRKDLNFTEFVGRSGWIISKAIRRRLRTRQP